MRFFTKILLAILILLLTPKEILSVASDNYSWVTITNGLTGNKIVGVAVDPTNDSTVYALTSGSGVYKTTNGGTSWSAVNTGLPDTKTVSWGHLYGNMLTIDSTGAVLYANFGGIPYKTTDSGANWASINSGIDICAPNYQIAGVIIDPGNSNHLYAAHVASGCGGGVYESTNQGTSWTRNQIGATNDMWPLAIDPSDTTKMYMSTVHEENYRSTDSGVNWSAMTFPTGYGNYDGQDVAVHPTNHSVLIGLSGGVVRSTDYGVTFSAISTLAGEGVTGIEFAPSNPTIAYVVTTGGKIYSSSDSGATWSLVSTNSVAWNGISISATNSSLLYLGSQGGGMYKSTNGGTSVSAINSGIPTAIVINTASASRSNTSIYYAIAAGGDVYKTTDSGKSWVKKGTLQDPLANFVWTVRVDPNDPTVLYSGVRNIYKSTDSGATWNAVLTAASQSVTNILPRDTFYIDPTNSNNVWFIAAGASNKLYSSIDAGANWSSATTGITGTPERIKVDPTNSQNWYVPATYVWKSSNAGSSWSQTTSGIAAGDSGTSDIAINPSNPAIIYLATGTTVYKSTDSGSSFSSTSLSGESIQTVIVDSSTPTNVYAFGSDSTWYKSTDSGSNWATQPSTNYPAFPKFSAFADPADSTRFISGDLVGTSGSIKIFENYIPLFDQSTFTVSSPPRGVYVAGDTLNFTFTLKNTGPAEATNPAVRIVLPGSLTFVSGSAAVDGTTISDPISGQTITYTGAAPLLQDEYFTLTFQAKINSGISGNVVIDPLVTSSEDTSGTSIADITINVATLESTLSSAGAPTCTTTAPSKAPDLFQINTTGSDATLFFAPAGEPNTNYYISYGKTSAAIGYSTNFSQGRSGGAIKFKIGKLSPKTAYYFKVRGANGCQPGPWSGVLRAITGRGKSIAIFTKFSKFPTFMQFPSTYLPTSRQLVNPTSLPSPRIYSVPTTEPNPPQQATKTKTCTLWGLICW